MPRPTDRPTGAVWALLKEWSDNHPLRPNQGQMAGLFGVTGSLLSSWKLMDSVMQADDMKNIADRTGISLARLAEAVAVDSKTVALNNQTRRAPSAGRRLRAQQDADAESEA